MVTPRGSTVTGKSSASSVGPTWQCLSFTSPRGGGAGLRSHGWCAWWPECCVPGALDHFHRQMALLLLALEHRLFLSAHHGQHRHIDDLPKRFACRHNKGKSSMGLRLCLCSLLAGWLLTPLGISKIRATPTWGLYSAGAATLAFLALYWVCDVHKHVRWAAIVKPAVQHTAHLSAAGPILRDPWWSRVFKPMGARLARGGAVFAIHPGDIGYIRYPHPL